MATLNLAINKTVIVRKDGTYEIAPNSVYLSLPHKKYCTFDDAIQEGIEKLKEPGMQSTYRGFFTGEYVDTPLVEVSYELIEDETEMLKNGTWVINSRRDMGAWKRFSRHQYLCVVDYETAKAENRYNIGWPIWFPNRRLALNFLYNDGPCGIKVKIK